MLWSDAGPLILGYQKAWRQWLTDGFLGVIAYNLTEYPPSMSMYQARCVSKIGLRKALAPIHYPNLRLEKRALLYFHRRSECDRATVQQHTIQKVVGWKGEGYR